MINATWARSVRVKRKKTGLDFSIKGGREHGIGVVVSWIKEGGAAASSLCLGDEILAVNNHSVQGLTHTQTVDLLKGAGSTITLLVRPNQTLEDIFAGSDRSPPASLLTSSVTGLYSALKTGEQQLLPPAMDTASESPSSSLRGPTKPLPPGWSKKLDHKTGHEYFENHYTCTSTWCDPCSRTPVPLEKFEWNTLPPGWERFLDLQGDVYYVNHHTQSTHWDSPWGNRHQQLQKQLSVFLSEHRKKVQGVEEQLERKRKLLLEKNHQLSLVSVSGLCAAHQEDEENDEGSSDDLIEDMMLLNEEVEAMEEELAGVRRHLQSLTAILHSARAEDLGEKEHMDAAELAMKLLSRMTIYHQLVTGLVALVESIDRSRGTRDLDTPLRTMLQLPVPMEVSDLEERQNYLHVLPDKLTAKTTSELRLDLAVLEEMEVLGEGLHKRLQLIHSQVRVQLSSGSLNSSWEYFIEQLASMDFQPLQENCIMKHSFKEKLDKLLTF